MFRKDLRELFIPLASLSPSEDTAFLLSEICSKKANLVGGEQPLPDISQA
jgi:hypothetical protein